VSSDAARIFPLGFKFFERLGNSVGVIPTAMTVYPFLDRLAVAGAESLAASLAKKCLVNVGPCRISISADELRIHELHDVGFGEPEAVNPGLLFDG
jgi:hypothetical protein